MQVSTHTFQKAERLKSRKRIDQLFKEGRSLGVFPLRALYAVAESTGNNQPLQATVSVSSRNFKKAVHRNRIKRVLREAYRNQKELLSAVIAENNQQLDIFIIYTAKELPNLETVSRKMHALMHQLSEIIKKTST